VLRALLLWVTIYTLEYNVLVTAATHAGQLSLLLPLVGRKMSTDQLRGNSIVLCSWKDSRISISPAMRIMIVCGIPPKEVLNDLRKGDEHTITYDPVPFTTFVHNGNKRRQLKSCCHIFGE